MTLASNFFPFVEFADCARCGLPVLTWEAIAVTNAGSWAGFAHAECPTEVGE